MRLIHVVVFAAALAGPGCKKKREEPAGTQKPAETTQQQPGGTTPKETQPGQAGQPTAQAARTVLDAAAQAGNFKTLLTAIDRAGLTDTLKGAGPFTLFAPTDDAFAKLPKPELDALLADKARLSSVLSYHVVPGTFTSKDLAGLQTVKTLNGQELKVETSGGTTTVGGATVAKTEITAANGVIHPIDTVLMPTPPRPGS